MKKLAALLLPFVLTACNSLGSKRVKNIIELTPSLSASSTEAIIIDRSTAPALSMEGKGKHISYTIAKGKIISPPAFAKNVIYSVDNKGSVSAFSRENKTMLWTQNIAYKAKNYNYTAGGISYNNEKLYITNGSKFLIVLASNNGHEIMRKEFPDIIKAKPVMLSNNIVLIQTVNNQLFAYDLAKSAIIWQHEGLFETLSSSYHISPIVYNGQVIVSYTSGQIFSLNATTGKDIWLLNLSTQPEISLPSFESVTLSCQPIIEGQDMYIANSTNRLIKINLLTGAIIWETNANDIQSMSISGNSLFITNNAKQVAAVSKINGKIKWVGDLILSQNKRGSKASYLLAPFISKQDNGWALNVVIANGEIYSFPSEGNSLSLTPYITKILKNIQYSGNSCCGEVYIAGNRNIIFLQ